jgi:hypothetical protein
MAKNTTTHVIRARLDWAKVLGAPRLNTYSEENEWSVDATPLRDEDLAELKRIGLTDKLRDPKENDTREDKFLSFRLREFRNGKDGERIKNQPIKVVDVTGQAWPDNKMIGNGTVADVKFNRRDYGKGKPKGMYIQALRILEHVPYEVQEFAPLSSDDEYFAGEDSNEEVDTKGESGNPDDLDDDIPF